MSTRALIFILGALAAIVPGANAQDRWITTWAASPQAPRGAPASAPASTTASAPAPPSGFSNQTIRMVVHTSLGGRRARVQLSNTFGTTPLKIGAAHVALRDKESAINPCFRPGSCLRGQGVYFDSSRCGDRQRSRGTGRAQAGRCCDQRVCSR
jgi:hypothetical protein